MVAYLQGLLLFYVHMSILYGAYFHGAIQVMYAIGEPQFARWASP